MILWHNPRCSKSRQAVAFLQDRGVGFEIRKYLDDAPDLDALRAAQAALGVAAIDMMRVKEAAFKEMGLSRDIADDMLLQAMAQNPKLIERPILFNGDRAAIGRPTEALLAVLDESGCV